MQLLATEFDTDVKPCFSFSTFAQLQLARRLHAAVSNRGMIASIRHMTNKDNVQALMSMGDARRMVFNDRDARVHPKYKEPCATLEVLDNSALTKKDVDAGSVKTLVHLPALHPNRQETDVKKNRLDSLDAHHQ